MLGSGGKLAVHFGYKKCARFGSFLVIMWIRFGGCRILREIWYVGEFEGFSNGWQATQSWARESVGEWMQYSMA